ncbi:hypothetical protein JCM9140_3127 [Halalkalibacter wakoensis JCM 9140]|uniref:Uncharacterized protein n=1 Tax=Halalkalibacter wakoensis JCM 9140 TaxID=1236970 RepID=W4Q4K9_9BACI|nr:hypothetical protein [Halalkalibacter wakoensis]GAE27016.1 hypothetical protein JCM9140_3127 [Halalkalibacter wakoensis JCM 9140]
MISKEAEEYARTVAQAFYEAFKNCFEELKARVIELYELLKENNKPKPNYNWHVPIKLAAKSQVIDRKPLFICVRSAL